MLNASKGAAVRGPRVQADRKRYKAAIHALLDAQDGPAIVEGEASALRLEGRRVTGLDLADGRLLTRRRRRFSPPAPSSAASSISG